MQPKNPSVFKYILFIIIIITAVPALPIFAQDIQTSERIISDQASFRLVRVIDGLQNPWSLAFLPDGGILITERPGRLLLLRDGRLTSVTGLPRIFASGQGGLLDVALHPDYKENGWIYFTFSATGRGAGSDGNSGSTGGMRRTDSTGDADSPGSAGTALYRARLSIDRGGTARLDDGEELYRLPRFSTTRVHFGSRIAFAPDGTIYMSIGDRGDRRRARILDDAAGSTLRFNDDGSIPADNPFISRPDALPEIYSYGHRNAQGMAVHPETGRLWQHEHGPRGGDEINIIRPGADYGWPTVSFGEEYRGGSIGVGTAAPGIESPVLHWTPSIAPSGMSFYSGNLFPQWRGDLFVGALAGRHLRRIELNGEKVVSQEILLNGRIGRIRDVRQGPEGRIWLLTDAANGALYRIEP